MKEVHIKIFTGSSIFARRLKTLLEDQNINSIIKSDKIPAYEITNYIDDLYVLTADVEKAKPIVETFQEEINS